MLTCDGKALPSRIFLFGKEEIEAQVFTKIQVVGKRKPKENMIYCKLNTDDKLIYQIGSTNSLEVRGVTDRTIKAKLNGNPDLFDVNNHVQRNFRFAKDDKNLIWVKGQGHIVKINEDSFVQLFELSDFFPQGYSPLYLCSNADGSMIYGYSTSSRNSVLSVNKQETLGKVTTNSMRKFEIRSGDSWVGMDLTFNEEFLVYFAITRVIYKSKGSSVFRIMLKAEALGNFNNQMYESRFSNIFDQELFSKASMVRRVKGYDIFLVVCRDSIVVFKMDKDEKKFEAIQTFEKIYNSPIIDLMMIMDMMFPIPRAEEPEFLRYIDFNSELRRLMEDDDRAQGEDLTDNSKVPPEVSGNYLHPDIKSYKIPTKDSNRYFLLAGFHEESLTRLIVAHKGIAILGKTQANDFECLAEMENFDTSFLKIYEEYGIIVGEDKTTNALMVLDLKLNPVKLMDPKLKNPIPLPICQAYVSNFNEFIPWVLGPNMLSFVAVERNFGYLTIKDFFNFDSSNQILDSVSIIGKSGPNGTIIIASYDLL